MAIEHHDDHGHGNDLSLLALDDYTRVKQVTSALPRR